MLDGVLILAAPVVLLVIAHRVMRGMPVPVALLWAVVAVYALWASDLLFFPLIVDPALRAEGASVAAFNAHWVNLVPLATVHQQLTAPTGIAFRQLGGNLGLLLPLGLFGPALSRRLRRWRSLLAAALLCSVGIELLQAVGTLLGLIRRSVDVDDVIVNVLGAMIGFALWRLLSMLARAGAPSTRAADGDSV